MSHLCMVAFHFVLKYRFFIEDSFLDPLKYLQVLVFFFMGLQWDSNFTCSGFVFILNIFKNNLRKSVNCQR